MSQWLDLVWYSLCGKTKTSMQLGMAGMFVPFRWYVQVQRDPLLIEPGPDCMPPESTQMMTEKRLTEKAENVLHICTFWGPPACRVSHCVTAPCFYCSPGCRPHLHKRNTQHNKNWPSAPFAWHTVNMQQKSQCTAKNKKRRQADTRGWKEKTRGDDDDECS